MSVAAAASNPDAVSLGRWSFGETHYLDDATGDRIFSMRHIEAELSAFAEACRRCSALPSCPGVSRAHCNSPLRHRFALFASPPLTPTIPNSGFEGYEPEHCG